MKLHPTFSLLSMGIIIMLATSCQDPMEQELSCSEELQPQQVLTREKMTTQTINGALTSAVCETVWPRLSSQELYLICIPDNWNGELILYAHGYVSPYLDELTFDEAVGLAPLVTSLGYAFASTTYSANGLHIQQGVDEMVKLKEYFEANYRIPSYTYLTGGSQGGVITTLALEKHPNLFDGGFSLCGPCGDFEKQMNHFGDFRLLFDYFFRNIISLPGSIDNISEELITNWDSYWVPKILEAIASHPDRTRMLLEVSKAPYDPNNPASIQTTVISNLWYNIFTIEDAKRKIKGKIFDNTNRWYIGAGNPGLDIALNRNIARTTIVADGTYPLSDYETTGNIADPLVMMHTTKDPIQLFWNMPLYGLKVAAAGKLGYFAAFPVQRYGHCEFTDYEILTGLFSLITKVKLLEQVQAPPAIGIEATDKKLVVSVRRELL
ncbi:DUF6351 family protein [Cesiribacter sp. SM1]|uniref:DUF6351 family protein n=1 Tax=Cesiribacter sp. SM1 TaxID=2861196 RepID=UPI001CD2CD3E|nr:DUF6351 family protein [Cesiribacter sp. SM1]